MTSTLVKVGWIREIQWNHDDPERLHLTLLNVPVAWHDHFCTLFLLLRTEQSSTILFHRVKIIQSSVLICLNCPFPSLNDPTILEKKCSQTCQIFFTYPLTQCISLHNYEAHLWPRTGLQPLDCLSLILDSIIKLSNKGLVLLKYEKEMGTERKGNEKRETVKVY